MTTPPHDFHAMVIEARTAIEALRAGVPNRAAIRLMARWQQPCENLR